jgi:hypothetical protein
MALLPFEKPPFSPFSGTVQPHEQFTGIMREGVGMHGSAGGSCDVKPRTPESVGATPLSTFDLPPRH